MTITYTTKSGEYAREYTANIGDLRVMLDKTNPEYLGWCVFIVKHDGPTYVEADRVETVLHTYTQTLKEAKAKADEFVAAYHTGWHRDEDGDRCHCGGAHAV